MIEDRADQPVAPLPLQEMLIEDDVRREPEPVCRNRSAGGDVFQIGVAGDHHFAQDCRACARAAHDCALLVTRADQFVEPGAGYFLHKPVLIAPWHPDERGRFQRAPRRVPIVEVDLHRGPGAMVFPHRDRAVAGVGLCRRLRSTATTALRPPASSIVLATTASLVAPPPTTTRTPTPSALAIPTNSTIHKQLSRFMASIMAREAGETPAVACRASRATGRSADLEYVP